jgi:hypothetical protein
MCMTFSVNTQVNTNFSFFSEGIVTLKKAKIFSL